jgi:hypothetical protein
MTNYDEPVAPDPAETEPVAVDPLAPDADAPYGYMVDPASGERRAKKRPGRQKVAVPEFSASTPSVDELKASKGPVKPDEDRSPDAPQPKPRGKRSRTRERAVKAAPATVPPFRAGPIAAGMNRLYARAGRIIRVWDHDIGTAIIQTTRKDSDDDVSVGEAWEEFAKVNPRVRGFLLKLIETSAASQLFMAHAPIFLAILMKEGIRKHIPFGKLLGAVLQDDDGAPSDVSQTMGGIQPEDLNDMMAQGMAMFSQMMGEMPRSAGGAGPAPRDPSIAEVAVITTLPEAS